MGYRLWRRVQIIPGVRMNLSKSGASLSFGVRGAHYTVGPRGRRVTLGLPGTGLYYTQQASNRTRTRRSPRPQPTPLPSPVRPQDQLRLGFFKRLVTPPEEQSLVAGIKELLAGNDAKALDQLRHATHLPDGAFMAGFLALKSGFFAEAVTDLEFAVGRAAELGRVLEKYKATLTVDLAITETFMAHLPLNAEGAGLALVEAYQRTKQYPKAIATLEGVLRAWPDDPVVKLSLVELLLDSAAGDRTVLQRVVTLTDDVPNLTPVHTALSLYRARALRGLGLADAAAQTLTSALALKKDRSSELLLGLRYERALAFEQSGQPARARTEFERIYAEDSHYEDVATRLGLH